MHLILTMVVDAVSTTQIFMGVREDCRAFVERVAQRPREKRIGTFIPPPEPKTGNKGSPAAC